ncbi:MAG: TonB-dependent receptor plug domain-containing protein, partial [Parafilimonas sp.]
MNKKIFYCLSLTIISFKVYSQPLTGKITDNRSNPVSDAFIYLLNTNMSAFSNAQGNFSFKYIPAGEYTVSVSAVGYATVNREFSAGIAHNELNIQLTDASGQLDEVVVTAQKKEESLQKIPLSITSISSTQVQQYRLWNSKELTAIVPNLYSNNSGDERNVTSIRGIVTTSYDPAVTTYIDGVNQFSLDTYIANLSDIERIEVLRGPQGTLYGRNAMGGVINIITKQPGNNTSGFAELNMGN